VYIEGLAENGVVDGYPAADETFEFRPEQGISRAEIVKLIVTSLSLPPEDEFDGSVFDDWESVAPWARPYIGAAVKAGIVNGSLENGALLLNAGAGITRQEMIAMAVRALNITGAMGDGAAAPEGISDFGDASDWARETLAFALANGLINSDNGKSRPLDGATRAEAAMMLYNTINYVTSRH
jgi:hypothetical protein